MYIYIYILKKKCLSVRKCVCMSETENIRQFFVGMTRISSCSGFEDTK